MKQLLLPILLLSFFQLAYGESVSKINGTINSKYAESINLFKTILGRLDTIATAKPAADGSFSITFKPSYSGFYTIKGDRWEHKLYLKPGDHAYVALNDTLLTLTGQNTAENVALYEWEKIIYRLNRMSIYFPPGNNYTYKDMFPELETVQSKSKEFLKSLNTGNKEFDKLMAQTIPFDIDYAALMSIYTPRVKHPKPEEYPAVITDIFRSSRYSNDDALTLPYGTRLIGLVVMYRAISSNIGPNQFDAQIALIGGIKSKVEQIIEKANRSAFSYNDYDSLEVKYGNLFLDPDQVSRLNVIKNRLLPFKTGLPAYDFSYPDADGKLYSLSNFKGKVVLVDLWATWCGPCVMEFPHLKKLEEQYRGKDLVVIGVSLDLKNDYKKWKEFLRKEQPTGIQLFAGGWTKIAKDYQIRKIPRYMLFDKQGNIVTTNAPRPSSRELQKYIDRELSK